MHLVGILKRKCFLLCMHVKPSLGGGQLDHNIMQFINIKGKVSPTHAMKGYRGN